MTWFHWYGFFIGLGVIAAIELIRWQAQHRRFDFRTLESAGIWIAGGAILGARLYHVATDWPVYAQDWGRIVQVWQGGLSIIGAGMGGGIALFLWQKFRRAPVASPTTMETLDLLPFGLPFGQAIGRIGNFINHELFGLPTSLPWGIFIPVEFRPAALASFSFFHPLFAYEALAMLIFGGALWWQSVKVRVGTGQIFRCYVAWYATVRFGLDFLRIDKAMAGNLPLSVNQVVMVGVFLLMMSWEISAHPRVFRK